MFSELDSNTQSRLFHIVTQWGSFLSLTHKRVDQLLDQVDSRMEILISNHTADTSAILSAWRCLSNQLLDIKEEATDDYNRNTSALGALIRVNESLGKSVGELKQLALTWTKQYDILIKELESRYTQLKSKKDLTWEEKLSSYKSKNCKVKGRYIRPTRPMITYKHLSLADNAPLADGPSN